MLTWVARITETGRYGWGQAGLREEVITITSDAMVMGEVASTIYC
jgi:hypothetical protein